MDTELTNKAVDIITDYTRPLDLVEAQTIDKSKPLDEAEKLFFSLSPARASGESFQDYKFRQKLLRKTTKRFKKGFL